MRDVQALVETLDRLIARHRSPGTHALLKKARRAASAHRARTTRRERLLDADFSEKRAALRRIALALPALPWTAIREQDVRMALQASVAGALVAGDEALDNGKDTDWHRWRRRMRRLSQQHRVLRRRNGQSPAEIRDKALAVLLGEAQDYCLLSDHCGKHSPFSVFNRQALRALAEKGLQRKRALVAGFVVGQKKAAETSGLK
jgi:hypothetical protein